MVLPRSEALGWWTVYSVFGGLLVLAVTQGLLWVVEYVGRLMTDDAHAPGHPEDQRRP